MLTPTAEPAQPTQSTARRKLVGALIRVIGPLLLVLVILRIKDRRAVLDAITSANGWFLVLAVLLNGINLHLKVIRWDALLRVRGIHYPIRRAWGASLTSLYVGMLTPGRVGDVLRVHYLRHDLGTPYAEGLACIVMDRLCDLYVLAAFVAFGVARYSAVLAGRLAWVTWGGLLLTVLGPLVLLIPGLAERLMRTLHAKLSAVRVPAAGATPPAPAGASDVASNVDEADSSGLSLFLEALRAQIGRSLFKLIPLTAATFLINYVQGSLVAKSIGLPISFLDVTCLLAIASLLGLLPISVSGVGVREFFFALIFPWLGCTAEQGVSFGLLVFAVIYLAIVALGFVSWQLYPPPGAPARAAPS